MRIELPFGRDGLAVDLPAGATVLRPAPVAALNDPGEAVRNALCRPLAGPSLSDRVRPGGRVAIVISDITRPVPNQTLLPPLIDALRAAGLDDASITIVNGTGLHRPNTPAELEWMLGPELLARFPIVQHDAFDAASLVTVGHSGAVPVELCRAYVEADVKIATGFVEPHLFAGYSGGAKAIMPGVAGAAIVMHNHGAANLAHPGARWLVAAGNPVFDEMQATVALCPPTFLLNVTLDVDRGVTGVFAGDWQPAHAAAIVQARRQYAAPIDRPYDVVLTTNMGYPADTTLYQSVKGISVAAEGVREDGAILLAAACDEGIGGAEYVSQLTQGASPAALLDAISSREHARHDQWQIQCQVMAQAKADVYLHSRLSRAETESAHLRYVDDLPATLAALLSEARAAGHEGSLLVLPFGQLTVPVVA